MSIQAMFDEVGARMQERDDAVDRTRMMASDVLRIHRKIFAMVVDGDLVVKVPRERATELVDAGIGRPFAMGKRVMREWVRLRPVDEATCEAHMVQAREFVGSLTGS